jgi:hypothetical protein
MLMPSRSIGESGQRERTAVYVSLWILTVCAAAVQGSDVADLAAAVAAQTRYRSARDPTPRRNLLTLREAYVAHRPPREA